MTAMDRDDVTTALMVENEVTAPTGAPGLNGDAPDPNDVTPEAAPDDTPLPRPPLGLIDVVGFVGRTLVTTGTLILLFAAYQVWGTNLVELYAQRSLDAELDELFSDAAFANPSAPSGLGTGAGGENNDDSSAEDRAALAQTRPSVSRLNRETLTVGSPFAKIDIPKIDLTKAMVIGSDRESLRKGPGHYPDTALPGHAGNSAIAGHRTTNGAPFEDIDQLEVGDEIHVTTADGTFTYLVDAHPAPGGGESAHLIVDPTAVEVIEDFGDNRLTLTACHPKFSARQRIIVTATLVGEPIAGYTPLGADTGVVAAAPSNDSEGNSGSEAAAPLADGTEPADERPVDESSTEALETTPDEEFEEQTLDAEPASTVGSEEIDDLGWNMDEVDPTVMWAVITALLAFAAWLAARKWRPRITYAASAFLVLPALFMCFLHLDRMLPAF